MQTSRSIESQVRMPPEAGIGVPETCRKYGVAEATFYRLRGKYGLLTKIELARLKDLEPENVRLKGLVVEFTLDKRILQHVLSGKD